MIGSGLVMQVLFEGHAPVRWLFTSKKSGQVMKRRLDHTNHLNIKVHKHRQIPAWWIVQSALCIWM